MASEATTAPPALSGEEEAPARVRVQLPAWHAAQKRAVERARRFNVVACGRRWGKTTLGIERLALAALAGRPVAWFGPTYKNLAESWRLASDILSPVTRRRSEQERRLELITGGVVDMWSLDEPDTARGRAYVRVVIDEAASVRRLEHAWQQVIRPTLTDFRGDAWFLSTPKGLNFFHTLYQRGLDPATADWVSWHFPTTANPHISPEEVAAAQRELPERVFAQEYLATFLEDGGGVFKGVVAAATAELQTRAQPGHQYVIGVDWAKYEDFSVLAVVDLSERALVWLDRFNQISYPAQLQRLVELYRRFRPVRVIAERNAMGDPLIDQLRRSGVPVWAFTTTNTTKGAAVEALALAFERRDVRIPNDPVLIGELQAYEVERLPSGLLRYTAPEGMHDDCVMALAMAWQGAVRPPVSRAGVALAFGDGTE